MDKRSNRRIPLALRGKLRGDKKGEYKEISRHSVFKGKTEEQNEQYKKDKKKRIIKKKQAEEKAFMGGIITNEDLIDSLDDLDFNSKLEFIRSHAKYRDYTYTYKYEVYKLYNELMKIEYFYKNYNSEESEEEFIESDVEAGDDEDWGDEDDEEGENGKEGK
jgi:hypothetical protein